MNLHLRAGNEGGFFLRDDSKGGGSDGGRGKTGESASDQEVAITQLIPDKWFWL